MRNGAICEGKVGHALEWFAAVGGHPWRVPRRRAKSLQSVTMLALMVACGDGARQISRVDEGKLCVAGAPVSGSPNSGAVVSRIESGQALAITVSVDECLSHSCDTERRAMCRVALDGGQIVLTSRLEWKNDSDEGCTDDCGELVARCATPPLEAGSYTLHFGDAAELPITVPGELDSKCID